MRTGGDGTAEEEEGRRGKEWECWEEERQTERETQRAAEEKP